MYCIEKIITCGKAMISFGTTKHAAIADVSMACCLRKDTQLDNVSGDSKACQKLVNKADIMVSNLSF